MKLLESLGPQSREGNRLLWEELKSHHQALGRSLSVGGDFNAVVADWERSGGNLHMGEMEDFNAFISDMALIDIRLTNNLHDLI